jgi:hypothetical protein
MDGCFCCLQFLELSRRQQRKKEEAISKRRAGRTDAIFRFSQTSFEKIRFDIRKRDDMKRLGRVADLRPTSTNGATAEMYIDHCGNPGRRQISTALEGRAGRFSPTTF